MEEKILNSFKKKLGKKAEGLDLIVSIPDNFEDEKECTILETKDNGKVWQLICTKTGNVKDILEIQ